MTGPADSHVKVYRASDAPPGALAGESVAVLGYGHLGRTAALNLRDSGAKVRIGNREDDYAGQARAEGWIPGSSRLPPLRPGMTIAFALLPHPHPSRADARAPSLSRLVLRSRRRRRLEGAGEGAERQRGG